MQFSRISVSKRGVELNYELRDQHKREEVKAFSAEHPLSSFADAMQAFGPFVIDLLEIPEAWRADLTVTTLNLSEDKNGNRGLIVTAVKPVEKAYDRPLVLNTPLVRQGGEDPSEEACVLSDEVLELIGLVESEAKRYLNGEREQRELFEGKAETSENAKEFDERAAHAENMSTRKPRGRKGKGPKPSETGVDYVANADHGPPLTDDVLRQLLLSVERDVPMDAIARWVSSDRSDAQAWAEARQKEMIGELDSATVPREPECVIRDATPALKADNWTSEPPPKVTDEAAREIQAAGRAD